MKQEDKEFLKPFEQLGIAFGYSSDGINYPARCPFSDKDKKLSVNKQTGLWQSFTAGKQGNLYTFLTEFYNLCLSSTKPQDLANLASNRKIPIQAFINEIAFNKLNGTYLIPVKNTQGSIINIGIYYPPKKIRRVAKCNTHIQNADLIEKNKGAKIFLCEGEWDMYALRWIFRAIGRKDVVCCVPGANIFKDAWVPLFKNREVYVCYDNDNAGYTGQQKVAKFLRPVSSSVKFIAWPELFKDKFDVRDLIVQYAGPSYGKIAIKKCVSVFDGLFDLKTKQERDNPEPESEPAKKVKVPTREELETMYRKWLKMTSMDALAVMYGTCFANKIQGEPVWTFIVAPPGGSKTELLMTIAKSPFAEMMTTLTAAALISGKQGAHDHSMLPKIDGRLLVIKDFTTILTGNAFARDEIFGILRDVYDGRVDKFFGTGEKKTYLSKFGILAGVTPAIDSYSSLSSSLGERFLKLRLDANVMRDSEDDKIRRALSNINKENKMREELQDYGYRFLEKKMPDELPSFNDDNKTTIIELAKFTARLRGSVPKDKFSHEQTSSPVTEVGTRLAKQFMKLCMGMAIYYDEPVITHEVLNICRRVAEDTCPELILSLVKAIYHEIKDRPGHEVSQEWIMEHTGLTGGTVSGLIANLMPLKILTRTRGEARVKCFYRLHPDIIRMIEKAELFGAEKFKGKEKKIVFKRKAK